MIKQLMETDTVKKDVYTRREAVTKLGATVGTAGVIVSSLSACSKTDEPENAAAAPESVEPKATEEASFFNEAELKTLAAICETIIPETDTLGAAGVDTHGFINRYLPACGTKWEVETVRHGVTSIEEHAKKSGGKSFHELSADEQFSLLTKFDQKAPELSEKDTNGFAQIKILTLKGYYTSEVGATKELKYLAIPGGYSPIKFSEVGRAWANPV